MTRIILDILIWHIFQRIRIQRQQRRNSDCDHRIHHGIFLLFRHTPEIQTVLVNVIQCYRISQDFTLRCQADITGPLIIVIRCSQRISLCVKLGILQIPSIQLQFANRLILSQEQAGSLIDFRVGLLGNYLNTVILAAQFAVLVFSVVHISSREVYHMGNILRLRVGYVDFHVDQAAIGCHIIMFRIHRCCCRIQLFVTRVLTLHHLRLRILQCVSILFSCLIIVCIDIQAEACGNRVLLRIIA